VLIVCGTKAGVVLSEDTLECVVQHGWYSSSWTVTFTNNLK